MNKKKIELESCDKAVCFIERGTTRKKSKKEPPMALFAFLRAT